MIDGMKALLDYHDAHWRAIADDLGICLGGVDCPVDDPYGNAVLIIDAIHRGKDVGYLSDIKAQLLSYLKNGALGANPRNRSYGDPGSREIMRRIIAMIDQHESELQRCDNCSSFEDVNQDYACYRRCTATNPPYYISRDETTNPAPEWCPKRKG